MQASSCDSPHMKENKIHPAGLGRGSNPKSRANLSKPKRKWIVLEQQSPNGRWIRFAGPMTQRKAYDLVRIANEAIRTGNLRGALIYCAVQESYPYKLN